MPYKAVKNGDPHLSWKVVNEDSDNTVCLCFDEESGLMVEKAMNYLSGYLRQVAEDMLGQIEDEWQDRVKDLGQEERRIVWDKLFDLLEKK